MVLTRRAAYRQSVEISRWLPNEVLVHIVQLSPKADQASLSRISRLFHDLCLPVLYRVVKIKRYHAIDSFCSSVVENPSRADFVRSFATDLPYSHYPQYSRSEVLIVALKLMLKLDHLALCAFALDGRHSLLLFEECNFPQLISCDIWAPWGAFDGIRSNERISDSIPLFLARHSTLKRVHIHPADKLVAPQSIRASLPNLEFYGGDAGFIPAIDARGLKSVQLTWFADADAEKIMLGATTVSVTPSSMMHDPGVLSDDTARHITECLPRFTSLVYLSLEWMNDPPQSTANSADRIVIEAWGEACPTLEGCGLYFHGWRKLDGRWEECPLKDFLVLAGLSETW
ncbi:hypothetical protein C8R45DRAFT_1207777 [Mycena sanguinolenta]|nr:hypothetical protein C8R45DRAFT_1207777 [Mycena sanguinolenta]